MIANASFTLICHLGGGFNPFEKYARQIGSFPQIGMKIKNIWNHHLGHSFGVSETVPYFTYMFSVQSQNLAKAVEVWPFISSGICLKSRGQAIQT